MFTKQMEKLADVLIEKEISKVEEKDLIVYGFSTGIELCFNIITTIVLGFLFGMVLESIVFLISFSFIRIYAGGYHCKKALNCYLMSSVIVVLILFIVKFTPNEYVLLISVILLLISVPIIFRFAPIGSLTKPLDEVERKYFRKKTILYLGAECALIPVLFLAGLYRFAFLVPLGIMISSTLVWTEKIFPQNN